MKEINFSVEKRKKLTKGQIKTYRGKGKIPAVVYGDGKEAIPVFVNWKEFQKIMHTELGGNVIIHLEIKDGNGEETLHRTVMLKEIQRDPVKDLPLHIDFHQISLKKEIEVTVPLQIVGEAKGVRDGGVLEQYLWEIKIRCLPTKIPESMSIDINELEIGKSLLVKDLSLPKGVEILTTSDQVVLSVVMAPRIEEVAVPAPTPAEVAEPEVIGKGKKEKEEKEEKEEEKEEVKEK